MGELFLIILVFVCGLVAMLVEMFLPGMVIGMIGLLAVAGSIVYAFATGHTTVGVVLIACGAALAPVFFVVWKNVLGRLFTLKGEEKDFRPSTDIGEHLVGVEGEAITPLRPSGIARLNDKRTDVVTRGEMLQKGAQVRVVEVSGNRVVVREA